MHDELQASTRFVYDVPRGVKAGMKWLYANVLNDPLEQCSAAHWPALLYAVAFLHVTLRERSRLGPPAWNVPYDCTLSTLSNTVTGVQNYLDGLERSKVDQSLTIHLYAWHFVSYRAHTIKIFSLSSFRLLFNRPFLCLCSEISCNVK